MDTNPFYINLKKIEDNEYLSNFNKNLYKKTSLKFMFFKDKKRDLIEGIIYFEVKNVVYSLPLRKTYSNKTKFLEECSETKTYNLLEDFLVCRFPFYDNGDFNLQYKVKNKTVAYVRSRSQFFKLFKEKVSKDISEWI